MFEYGNTTLYFSGDASGLTLVRLENPGELLVIPEVVNGMHVRALAGRVLSSLRGVQEIICNPGLTGVGPDAFAWCSDLERLVLPKKLATVDASWFKHCDKLVDLVLPGSAREIPAWFLSGLRLQSITIGAATEKIDIPPALRGSLMHIEVDPDNPFISTDGSCLYDKSGTKLLACIVWSPEYKVLEGCERIGEDAFAQDAQLRRIALPQSLHAIERNAFTRSGLVEFAAPSSLHTIAARAFYECGALEHVELNEGLVSIGDAAFESCKKVVQIRIPSTVEELGPAASHHTKDSVLGSWPALVVDGANPHVRVDAYRVLYYRGPRGWEAVQATDVAITRVALLPDTVRIDDFAFTKCTRLKEAHLNDGLLEIGAFAFSHCYSLAKIDLPDTVRSVGENAFAGSRLEAFAVPRDLQELGEGALIVDRSDVTNLYSSGSGGSIQFAHRPEDLVKNAYDIAKRSSLIPNGFQRSLSEIEPHRIEVTVHPENERFYIADGLLCAWLDDAHTQARGILYVGVGPSCAIPDEVVRLDVSAFDRFKCVTDLSIGPKLAQVARLGLSFAEGPFTVTLRSAYGEDAHLWVIPNEVGSRRFASCFLSGRVDYKTIAANCDLSLTYVAPGDDITRIIARLGDPVLLSDEARGMFDTIVKRDLQVSVTAYARTERVDLIEALVELGYINAENLDWALDICRAENSVKAMSYLLEARRGLGLGAAAVDYDI